MFMITERDVDYFIDTLSRLDRAILNVDKFQSNLNDYYSDLVERFNEFQNAFKFKVLPETAKAFNYVKQHINDFITDLRALISDPSLRQYKLFMQKLYYDIKMISLELQTVAINLNAEKNTLDLLIKFPNWLLRHYYNGDFYNYTWVYDKINEIESDAPRFFSLFANEFNEMRELALDTNLPEKVKAQRMDELVQLLVAMSNDILRASVA